MTLSQSELRLFAGLVNKIMEKSDEGCGIFFVCKKSTQFYGVIVSRFLRESYPVKT